MLLNQFKFSAASRGVDFCSATTRMKTVGWQDAAHVFNALGSWAR